LATHIPAFDGFDWDAGNVGHATRHGVSRSEIEEAILNGFMISAVYERNGEQRYSAVAATSEGMPLDIVFTIRKGRLRPIMVHKLKRNRRRSL
jgi:uncharacterized DUF497 family protein